MNRRTFVVLIGALFASCARSHGAADAGVDVAAVRCTSCGKVLKPSEIVYKEVAVSILGEPTPDEIASGRWADAHKPVPPQPYCARCAPTMFPYRTVYFGEAGRANTTVLGGAGGALGTQAAGAGGTAKVVGGQKTTAKQGLTITTTSEEGN